MVLITREELIGAVVVDTGYYSPENVDFEDIVLQLKDGRKVRTDITAWETLCLSPIEK